MKKSKANLLEEEDCHRSKSPGGGSPENREAIIGNPKFEKK